ncbi:MAG: [FeFe] hydrogenase H-cluster maturation GTPase HydF [Lactobacillus sp.]|jgi:[FeFe] hydrogenase H-cluster maturation GTPase HydF|nr:[FeFe] hydrogenase H-cluster maturation GTPase HydF [Lactobacillus sp.]
MEKAPKGIRLQIAILGRVNSGKSSFLNLVSGQDTSITSPIKGTTTDVVEKNQELQPIGPITWLDTAGFADDSDLGDKRLAKTLKVLDRADIAVLVLEGSKIGPVEEEIIKLADSKKIPLIKIFNKNDLYRVTENGIRVNSTDLSSRDELLSALKEEILKICPADFIKPAPLLGDLAPEGSTVVMIVPIDFEAPKGRLILPQVQAIRDCLDHDQTAIITKESGYPNVLKNLRNKPSLVVCDSQGVDFMVKNTPRDIACTTFSMLFARQKGDLGMFIKGAKAISTLKDGDKVLISECCTHHASDDDIGKVKIPNLLKKETGKKLDISFASGHVFPDNLSQYQLIIQCGGCMFGRKEILSRLAKADEAGVPITNYGVCISALKGVLDITVKPFKDTADVAKD